MNQPQDSNLARTLAALRPQLEADLESARTELRVLDERRTELTALISQAEAALGLSRTPTPPLSAANSSATSLTLHEAMAVVLRDHDNQPLTAPELAAEINSRGLYRQRDGGVVPLNQIHARARNYSHMFAKDGNTFFLIDAAEGDS